TSGMLQGSTALTLPNTFSLANSNITFSGNQAIIFSGNGSLSGISTLVSNNPAGTQFNGPLVGGGGLILLGNAPLFLSNSGGASDYAGGTVLKMATGGSVTVNASSSLGAGGAGTLTLN